MLLFASTAASISITLAALETSLVHEFSNDVQLRGEETSSCVSTFVLDVDFVAAFERLAQWKWA